jgi:hypothetical protein
MAPPWLVVVRSGELVAYRQSLSFPEGLASHFWMVKTKRPKRRQNLIRTADIRSFEAYVGVHVTEQRGAEPGRGTSNWLLLHGMLDEPVKGHSQVAIRVVEDQRDEPVSSKPPAIGHVLGTNPEVSIYVTVPSKLFERIWTLAAGGNLSYAWISMTPPHYGSAVVQSLALSSKPLE